MCRLSAFNSGGTGALRVGRTSPGTFPRSSVGMRGKSPPPPRSQNFFVKTGRKPRWTFGVPGSKIRLFQTGPDTGCRSMMITSSPTSFSYASKGETARRLARRLSLFYSRTSTGPAMSNRSGWTAQSRASTCTPSRAARRRASPNSGWVRSLGSIHSTSPIWTTKHTAAS